MNLLFLIAVLLSPVGRCADSGPSPAPPAPPFAATAEPDEAAGRKPPAADEADTTSDLTELAQLLHDSGNPEEAEPLLRRALEITINSDADTGGEHPGLEERRAIYRSIQKNLGMPDAEEEEKLRQNPTPGRP
jgi:hypothetical protein